MDKELNKTIINAILIEVIVILFDLFYNACTYGVPIVLESTKCLIFSMFFILSIFFILLAILKKTNRAFVILSIILLIFTFLNEIKIYYTDTPITFADILFLNNTGELSDIIGKTLINSIKSFLPYFLVYMFLDIIIWIIAYKCSMTISNKKLRIFTGIISFCLLIISFLPLNFINNFISYFILETDSLVDYNRYTTNTEIYSAYGIIPGMYYNLCESRISEPDNYSDEEVEEIIENATENTDKIFGDANIIVLFAESFWDVELIDEIEFDKEITQNFNELKDEGIFINMISPSYGGVSVNIEFQFLTGANLMYFCTGYIPTMQLYRNKTYYSRPSIITELKNNGYRTKIVNFTSKNSFSVYKFYDYIGVDEVEFDLEESQNYIKGYYVSDEYVVDKIIEEFDNKSTNEKLFYMTLTMQSHMSYLYDKYNDYDISIIDSSLEEEQNNTLLSYAQGIYDTDQQLKRLYEYIQTLEEPTILVFYGDHLPYLKTIDNTNIIDSLSYFNTGDETLDYYRLYNTQALILANFDIEDDETQYMGSDILGSYVINNMDIEISDYFKLIYSYKDNLASSNWYVTQDADGNLYSTSDLPEDLEEIYLSREKVQYKYFIK